MKTQSILQKFEYHNKPIQVLGTPENPLFIAQDLCNALGISKYRDAVAKLDEDERCPVLVDTLGGKQNVIAVNEPGMYTLILRSNKPEAKAFKRWVTHEVLPTLRKTGVYEMPNPKPAPAPVAKTVFEPNYLSEKVQLLEKIVQLQEKLLAVPVQKPQRPKKAPLTSAEKATILQLWREGKGCTAIGKVVNRNDSSIRYQLKQMGARL